LPGPVEETRVKKYNAQIRTWALVPVGHVITLKPGDHVFLKGCNVTYCHDFDTLFSGSQNSKPHFSDNLRQERTHVREALKERKDTKHPLTTSRSSRQPRTIAPRFTVEPLCSPISLASSSDDDNADQSPLVTRPGRNIKVEPTDSDCALRVKPTAERIVIDLTASDTDDNAAPAVSGRPSKRGRALSSPPSTPGSSCHHVGSSSASDDNQPTWPSDFYVVDIVEGFSACMKASQKCQSVETVFVRCFGVPFRSSTFYRHRRKWEGATEACRDGALKAGRTSAGLWSTFIQSSESNMVGVRRKKVRL
jgi:hypothetical protein